jgi:hypothetical protein
MGRKGGETLKLVLPFPVKCPTHKVACKSIKGTR